MGYLKDYVEHVSESFQTLFTLDGVGHLSEAENIDRVIGQTATVAWCVYCMVPFPVLDVATLTPIQAKMAVHIARLKGFEVTQERAKETVLEIVGVLGMTLTAQLMISSTAKLVPILGTVVGGPLVYAATHAIGNVVDYYYDCLRRDQAPSNEAMKDLFVESFRVGKAKGEKVDRSEIQKKADELRRRVAERDPSLATETRLPPREESLRRPPPAATPPQAPPDAADGRRKIKITLGGPRAAGAPRSDVRGSDEPPPAPEPSGPARKTIGPAGRVGPEPDAPPPPRTKSLGLPPEPAPPTPPAVEAPAAVEALAAREEERRLGSAPTPAGGMLPAPPETPALAASTAEGGAGKGATGSIVDQLERLGRLKAQGVLSPDEFDQAKRRILGL